MTDFLLIALLILFGIQAVTFFKIISTLRQMNKLLFEVRLLFKHSGIFFQPQKNKVIKSNSCQYCKYRRSFIQLTDEDSKDNFYYKCQKQDIEILLSDSCAQFQRDYRQV
ncbi:MAG: hypothetical protein V3U02_13420 [Calditrichia bacterium]